MKKRNITMSKTDMPLTSKRARILLSNPSDAVNLAKAIRAKRHDNSSPFKASHEAEQLFKDK